MAASTLQFGALPPARRRSARVGMYADAATPLLSVLLAACVVLLALAVSPETMHWFLLPLFGCGVLLGLDVVDWCRGKVDLFDAKGMLGLLGFHFLVLAPILMIYWHYRMRYLPEQPDDYRDWLGWMAALNFVGLCFYRLIVDAPWKRKPARPAKRWVVRRQRFWVLWTAFVLASLMAEAGMLIRFGGISGYLASYSSWLAGNGDDFAGAALLFAFAESLPMLCILAFAVWAHRQKPGLGLVVGVFMAFLVVNFVIGGLRGSRSNVIWTTFWAAGIVHLYVRRIPRVAALLSIGLLFGFVSLYAAYKQHGASLFDDYSNSGEYTSLNKDAEDLPTVLVGDFSRADVQANLLWRTFEKMPLQLALGDSYLGAAAMLIPRDLWPERPPTVVRWSTDAEYGNGAFASGVLRSTRVYGIAGEAMLNFGLLGIPLAFVALAFAVRAIRLFSLGLDRSDPRLMLVPFLVNTLFLLLLDDSDNVVFYLVKYGLIPVLLVTFSSSHQARRFLLCKLSPQPAPLATL